ncbi:hypothetical protein HETIRDRAFT_470495 [Heterobasidion irregulare TC 32-1]|uniref:Uncharacterized protein n=1 Tax=Heterobasidion irregulare (strain TC 32-1) TaxID=747525 RepID=W4KI11_HETIT|nr:uncharacterized protein HETIRDRAFT_470495 [Heterobasidion irregulare TC 32-1]ETW85482.1 hypothetical protein HETIRDRAFT_470495 [Heterobasidion irregulare TC 32-1]
MGTSGDNLNGWTRTTRERHKFLGYADHPRLPPRAPAQPPLYVTDAVSTVPRCHHTLLTVPRCAHMSWGRLHNIDVIRASGTRLGGIRTRTYMPFDDVGFLLHSKMSICPSYQIALWGIGSRGEGDRKHTYLSKAKGDKECKTRNQPHWTPRG